MADIYVRSTDGSDADSGATWALAKATATGAAAIDAAGDNIYLSSVHAESSATAVTLSWAGTAASPTKIYSVNDSAEPPTASASGATVTVTGAVNLEIRGTLHWFNTTFNVGSSNNNPVLVLNGSLANYQYYENCNFKLLATGASAYLLLHGSVAATAVTSWKNCTVKLSNTAQRIRTLNGQFYWYGGSLDATSSAIDQLLDTAANSSYLRHAEIVGVDFSVAASAANVIAGRASDGACLIKMYDCKMPASWSGLPISGTPGFGQRVEMYRCTSAYSVWVEDQWGELKTDTSVYGAAFDGTTSFSYKITTSADAEFPANVFRSQAFPLPFNNTTGSPVTVTQEIVFDSATDLTDKDFWIEIASLNTAGSTLATITSTRLSEPLGTGTNLTSSTAAWTGVSGFTNQKKRKVTVSFTPQIKGSYVVFLCCAKASTTLYADFPTIV